MKCHEIDDFQQFVDDAQSVVQGNFTGRGKPYDKREKVCVAATCEAIRECIAKVDEYDSRGEFDKAVTKLAKKKVRAKYGSILITIGIAILIEIIKLILQWWWNRPEAET